MEKTVVMIKPDGIQKNLVGEITRRIEQEGLMIVFSKTVKLTEKQVCELYKDSLEKFPQIKKEMVEYMTEAPSILMIVEGDGAIQKMRKIRGLTNPAKSPVGSVRRDFAGDYDTDELTPKGKVTKNIMHSSGTKEEADFETKLFFGENEA